MTGFPPEFVYLVILDGEWPVSAIADDHPSTAGRVEAEIARRREGRGELFRPHIWRARLTDLTEMDLLPSRTVGPELRERS